MRQVKIYDTTLRDGTQAEDFNLSLADKIRIAQKLAQVGIHYIEGGWPYAASSTVVETVSGWTKKATSLNGLGIILLP